MADQPDLRRLILDAKGDRSYDRMSTDCGGNPTSKRLQQMATGNLKAFPDADTLRGLARGTGRTITSVVLAAARSLGLQVHAGEDPDALVIGGAASLRIDQRDAVRALVRSFLESNAHTDLLDARQAVDSAVRRVHAARLRVATDSDEASETVQLARMDDLAAAASVLERALLRLRAVARPGDLSVEEQSLIDALSEQRSLKRNVEEGHRRRREGRPVDVGLGTVYMTDDEIGEAARRGRLAPEPLDARGQQAAGQESQDPGDDDGNPR